jgi:transposase InsO family protein
MVTALHENHAYPVAALCRLLAVPRSRYYYASTATTDTPVRQAVQAVAAAFPTYGSRRIAAQLRRVPYALQVNRKQVQRLMREMDLLRPLKRRVRQTTNSQHPWPRHPNLVLNRQAMRPDDVWVAEIV